MAATRIAPASFPRDDGDNIGDIVYELACRRVLPSLNGRKCIKNVLLRPLALRRFNYVLHHTKRAYPLLYVAALASGLVSLLVPSASNSGLAVSSLLCATPSYIAAFSTLRYDMVVLICKTFEFWYATIINILCMALICRTVNDYRAFTVISSALAHQLSLFIDAVYRAPSVAIAASCYGSMANVGFVILLIFQQLPNAQHIVLVTLLDRKLSSNVVIANGLLTIALLLARNAIRKYQIMKKFRKEATGRFVGSSIAYRCCVQLREVRRSEPSASRPAAPTQPSRPDSHTIQLVFDNAGKEFSARNVLLPARLGKLSLRPWAQGTRVMFNFMGFVGLAALTVSHLPKALVPGFGYHTEICVTAFVGSAVFSGVYVAHYQRQLLVRELGRSFDFWFITSQSVIAHLCVCELYSWDIRCFGAASSFIWMQWITLLDAVTPVMRRKLGFHEYGAIAVEGVLLFEMVSFVMDLVVFGSLKLRERELFSLDLPGREISVTVMPIFLGRVVLTFLWHARITWRLFDRKDHELLVLQGQLHYEDREMRRRATLTQGSRSTLTALLQTASWRTTSMMVTSDGSKRGPTVKNLTQ